MLVHICSSSTSVATWQSIKYPFTGGFLLSGAQATPLDLLYIIGLHRLLVSRPGIYYITVYYQLACYGVYYSATSWVLILAMCQYRANCVVLAWCVYLSNTWGFYNVVTSIYLIYTLKSHFLGQVATYLHLYLNLAFSSEYTLGSLLVLLLSTINIIITWPRTTLCMWALSCFSPPRRGAYNMDYCIQWFELFVCRSLVGFLKRFIFLFSLCWTFLYILATFSVAS